MTTQTKYTEQQLQEMFDSDPHKLDALAAEIVMGFVWLSSARGFFYRGHEVKFLFPPSDPHCETKDWRTPPSNAVEMHLESLRRVPFYSVSLDATAMLEEQLAERGLIEQWAETLQSILKTSVVVMDEADYEAVAQVARAKPHERTIAAILVAQSV